MHRRARAVTFPRALGVFPIDLPAGSIQREAILAKRINSKPPILIFLLSGEFSLLKIGSIFKKITDEEPQKSAAIGRGTNVSSAASQFREIPLAIYSWVYSAFAFTRSGHICLIRCSMMPCATCVSVPEVVSSHDVRWRRSAAASTKS
jgi:hypothetical protein